MPIEIVDTPQKQIDALRYATNATLAEAVQRITEVVVRNRMAPVVDFSAAIFELCKNVGQDAKVIYEETPLFFPHDGGDLLFVELITNKKRIVATLF